VRINKEFLDDYAGQCPKAGERASKACWRSSILRLGAKKKMEKKQKCQ